MSPSHGPSSRLLAIGLSATLLATACTGGDEQPTAASTTIAAPAQSLASSAPTTAAPNTAPATTAAPTTEPSIEDAPDSMAFVASRDLGRQFEVTTGIVASSEPSSDAEAATSLQQGDIVRAAKARLREEGMWVQVSAVAPGGRTLGWVLESNLTPASGAVQLSGTERQGTELETAGAPAEWLTIHSSPAGDTDGSTLGVGEQLVDTGGWALLENGDVWIEVADPSTGAVKGWVQAKALREVVEEEPEVQPTEDGTTGVTPEEADGSASTVASGGGGGNATGT